MENTILTLLEQICSGLYASHRAGVVHRDIKPANILLDEDDNAYLADFGIAKSMADEQQTVLTEGDVIIGSPAYIFTRTNFGRANQAPNRRLLFGCGTV